MFHRIAASLFATALLASSAAWAQTSLRSLPAEGFKHLSAKEVDALTDKKTVANIPTLIPRFVIAR